jgi:3-dehydroquinate synthase
MVAGPAIPNLSMKEWESFPGVQRKQGTTDMLDEHPGAIDRPFAVPFVHRLRFTQDVLGQDRQVLADVLHAAHGRKARVQFWIDENLLARRPDLRAWVRSFAKAFAGRLDVLKAAQVVPGGEAVKNDIQLLERVLQVLEAADLDRHSYVVVIGGGAVLDAVGFAAAIAHRGLRLVRLPTTTLAQADSGVGVKNGVNLFGKKNWVGCFAVPWAVVNDAGLLATLPDRDFVCGFAEAVKVALLKEGDFFGEVCDAAPRIARRDPEAALPVIRRSARLHLDHITRGGDPFELLEARPLDFGHWSAHKLEALTGYALRHGEAVAIGLAIDSVYSSLALGFPEREVARVLRCLGELGLPLGHPVLADKESLFAGLEEFRQHLGGRLTLTLLRGVADPVEVHAVDDRLMRAAIDRVAAHAPAAGGWAPAPATAHAGGGHCADQRAEAPRPAGRVRPRKKATR